jgi:hypothetical protein
MGAIITLPSSGASAAFPAQAKDIREFASGFAFDGTVGDSVKWGEALTAAPAGSHIKIPGLPTYIDTMVTIPKKDLRFTAEIGAVFKRKSAIKLFDVASGLDAAGKVAVTGIFVTSRAAYPLSQSNTIQTGIQMADASSFAAGNVVKLVSEDAATPQVPFDVGNSKLLRMGQIAVVLSVDTASTPNVVYVAGEIFDRASYVNERYLMKMDSAVFEWTGGTFVSEGAFVGVTPVLYMDVRSRVRPRVSKMNFINGSGGAIQFAGCLEYSVDEIDIKDMQNTATCPGYGVLDCSSQSGQVGKIRSAGDMRHGADAVVLQTSPATYQYDFHGLNRNPLFENISDFSSGHSPISPHVSAVGVVIRNVRSVWSGSGRSALGAGVSLRGARAHVSGVLVENRPVGIEVNDQVANQCVDNTIDGGQIYGTSTACFLSSLINNGTTENGASVRNLTVKNFKYAYARGVAFGLCTGSGYKFSASEVSLFGALAISAPGFVNCGGNDVEAEFRDMEFDLTSYSGATAMSVVYESAARTGIALRFVRCKFKGLSSKWASLVNAGTPVGTGTARNRYEFIDCDIPAGVPHVTNQGTAIVLVRNRSLNSAGFPNVGELLMSLQQIGGADVTPTYAPLLAGFTVYQIFDIPRIASFDAGIWMTVAQSAAAFRMAVYSEDSDGRIGQLITDLGEYDASALPGGAAGMAAPAGIFTNPYAGRFWVQFQLKARATTNITYKRASGTNVYAYPMTPAQWSSAGFGAPRGWASTETYGPAAQTPTSPVQTADTSMIPVILLRRTA